MVRLKICVNNLDCSPNCFALSLFSCQLDLATCSSGNFSSWLHCFAERLWIPNTTTFVSLWTKYQLIMNPAEILKYTLSTWLEYHSLRAGKYISDPVLILLFLSYSFFEGNQIINPCCMLNYTYDYVTFFPSFSALCCILLVNNMYGILWERFYTSACSAYIVFFFLNLCFFIDTCDDFVFINSSVSSTYFCVSSERGWVNGTILLSVSNTQKLWGFSVFFFSQNLSLNVVRIDVKLLFFQIFGNKS